MVKMSLQVVVSSIRDPKEGKNFGYADFAFLGGIISVSVSPDLIPELKAIQGNTISAVFEMKSSSLIRFNRPVTVFEAVSFLGIDK